jgi:hypothetical protein
MERPVYNKVTFQILILRYFHNVLIFLKKVSGGGRGGISPEYVQGTKTIFILTRQK